MIEINAKDRPGLLYDVTRALTKRSLKPAAAVTVERNSVDVAAAGQGAAVVIATYTDAVGNPAPNSPVSINLTIDTLAPGNFTPTVPEGPAINAAEIANTPFGKGEQNNVTALATWIAAESRDMKFNLPQAHVKEQTAYEIGKRLFFQRGGPHDFSCASCHGADDWRIRLQDLPNLTKNPGDGVGFAAWPAYRVSNGQMWSMQLRLNDCYRQQRFPYPGFGSDATVALGVYLGVNSQGSKSIAPAIKR